MCGIGALISLRKKKQKEEIITSIQNLMLALEERGTHASGLAAIYPDAEKIIKEPVQASEFVEGKKFYDFMDKYFDARVFLVHARQATVGCPKLNQNNHPLISKNFLVIHNGVIAGSLEELFNLFEIKGIDTSVQTDSYLINKAAELCGARAALKFEQSAYMLYDRNAKELYIVRNEAYQGASHPLFAGYCKKKEMLVIATTEEAIKRAFSKTNLLFNLIKVNNNDVAFISSMLKANVPYSTKITEKKINFKPLYSVPSIQSAYTKVLEGFYHGAEVYLINTNYYITFNTSVSKKLRKALAEFKKLGKFYVVPVKKMNKFIKFVKTFRAPYRQTYFQQGYFY